MKTLARFITFEEILLFLFCVISIVTTIFLYQNNLLLLYGDAESHLNISKRITSSITPGLAQLGGIWLPLPHLLMLPFTYFDALWATGLAGAIVSGISYIVAAYYLYKLLLLLSNCKLPSVAGTLAFGLNPNVLYMQSTAMTELLLIAFFVLSTYHFIVFLKDERNVINLIYAAFFGFCATLSRYDGWFLVLTEAFLLLSFYMRRIMYAFMTMRTHASHEVRTLYKNHIKGIWQTMEGKLLIFSVLGFLGIGIWILWNWLIMNDPIYFTNSPFSAKSQQKGWLGRGELPTYHNLPLSYIYYTVTSIVNIGYAFSALALAGLIVYLLDTKQRERLYVTILLLIPFLFYVVTLYLGQSVIFLPHVTPSNFTWNLFNVRYGLMMVPAAGFFIGYLFGEILKFPFQKHFSLPAKVLIKLPLFTLFLFFTFLQANRFVTGEEKIISFEDGRSGLASSRGNDAQNFLLVNYDDGLLLMDDYSRTISIIKSGVPMENVIYIGNKPYWEESLIEPEKHAEWIAMQKGDAVWRELIDNPEKQGRLYKYFEKAYTSPDILIFRRNNEALASQ